jgi:hypothetical protein
MEHEINELREGALERNSDEQIEAMPLSGAHRPETRSAGPMKLLC